MMLSRAEAILVARSWIGTPYLKGHRLKGCGADCGQFLAAYLLEIGAIEERDLQGQGPYSSDWFLHATEERYLNALVRFGARIAEGIVCRLDQHSEPGDLVLFRVVRSKRFNHGAVVTQWPRGVHAGREGVAEINLATHPLTTFRQMAILDPFQRVAR